MTLDIEYFDKGGEKFLLCHTMKEKPLFEALTIIHNVVYSKTQKPKQLPNTRVALDVLDLGGLKLRELNIVLNALQELEPNSLRKLGFDPTIISRLRLYYRSRVGPETFNPETLKTYIPISSNIPYASLDLRRS